MPTNQKSKSSTWKKIGGVVIILTISIIIIAHLIHRHNTYASLPQANTPDKIVKFNQRHNDQKKLTYEFYYRPDCKDCNALMKKGLVKTLRQQKPQLITINVKKFQNKKDPLAEKWLTENYVTNTPTLIVKSNGYPIYLYAGINQTIFKKLIKGINPKTNQKFKVNSRQKLEIYQNDFTKSNTQFVPIKPSY